MSGEWKGEESPLITCSRVGVGLGGNGWPWVCLLFFLFIYLFFGGLDLSSIWKKRRENCGMSRKWAKVFHTKHIRF